MCVPECGSRWVTLPSSLQSHHYGVASDSSHCSQAPQALSCPHCSHPHCCHLSSAVLPLLSDLGSCNSQAPRVWWSLGLDKPLLQAEPHGTPTHPLGNMGLELLPDLPLPSLPTFVPLYTLLQPCDFCRRPCMFAPLSSAHEGPCPEIPSPFP